MVIKTNRLARPFLAIAAIAFMALVAFPSADKAAVASSSYSSQTSTGTDIAITGGILALGYLIFAD